MSPTLLATKDGPRTFGFVQDGDLILCFVFEGKPSTCSRNPTWIVALHLILCHCFQVLLDCLHCLIWPTHFHTFTRVSSVLDLWVIRFTLALEVVSKWSVIKKFFLWSIWWYSESDTGPFIINRHHSSLCYHHRHCHEKNHQEYGKPQYFIFPSGHHLFKCSNVQSKYVVCEQSGSTMLILSPSSLAEQTLNNKHICKQVVIIESFHIPLTVLLLCYLYAVCHLQESLHINARIGHAGRTKDSDVGNSFSVYTWWQQRWCSSNQCGRLDYHAEAAGGWDHQESNDTLTLTVRYSVCFLKYLHAFRIDLCWMSTTQFRFRLGSK